MLIPDALALPYLFGELALSGFGIGYFVLCQYLHGK